MDEYYHRQSVFLPAPIWMLTIFNMLGLKIQTGILQTVNGNFAIKRKRQLWGLGSPASVAVVNLRGEEVEQTALNSFTTPVKTWKRYGYDTYVIISKEHVDPHTRI